nr:MAG TPA: hypothetical protein [Bacteriophage sp.]
MINKPSKRVTIFEYTTNIIYAIYCRFFFQKIFSNIKIILVVYF